MGKKNIVGKTADQLVKSGGARLWLYSPPFLTWAATPAIGGALYLATTSGRGPAMGVASMLTLATAGLPAFTWHAYQLREKSIRIHATATAAGMCLWTDLAAGLGLANWPVWVGWGVIGVGALTWGIRRIAQPKETVSSEPTAFEKALAGAKVSKPKVVEGRVVGKVVANRGEETITDVQKRADNIGAAMGVRPGGTRIIPSSDDAGTGEIVVVPHDPLVDVAPYPGPTAPGQSIADAPSIIGVYEDGSPVAVWLPGADDPPRALAHWLIGGVKGSGKSQGGCVWILDALTRTDVVVWGSDPAKARQTFGALYDHMDWVATDKAQAKAMVAALNAIVKERAEDLGRRNLKQWEKGCGLPLLVAWFEEAAEIAESSQSFVRLVERARSTGVVVIVAIQRPSHGNIDTDARSQLTGSLCFGMRDTQDATFVLSERAQDAGAQPELWSDQRPGYAYIDGPGLDSSRCATPLRTFRVRDDQIAEILAEWAPKRAKLDALSVKAAGAAYAKRAVEPARNPAPADDDEETTLPQLDPDIAVDPGEPVEAPDFADVPFNRPGGPKRTTAEAQAIVQQHLHTLLEAGTTTTQPADLFGMRPATGRSKEWVRKELGRLCTEPAPGEIGLERDDDDPPGVFRILAPATAGV